MKNTLDAIREQFGCGERDIRTYSPLTLAYIGDGVFEMIIRTVVISRADRSAKQLHRTTIQYVSAVAQSKIYDVLAAGDNGSGSDLLNDEELAFMKRGRNAGPAATSRNATAAEYRKATGLEALMGYLYLTGQTERAVELARIGLEKAGLEI